MIEKIEQILLNQVALGKKLDAIIERIDEQDLRILELLQPRHGVSTDPGEEDWFNKIGEKHVPK